MKLGLMAGPYTREQVALVQEAERLGYHSVWGGENYGADCFTPMAWLAAQTSTIQLGTIVAVVDARTPATTAMTAMTLDQLSSGRYTLGLGVSGPQVVEGLHGRPFRRPIARTREYLEIVRRVMRREEPVSYQGEFYQLPLAGGLGKPLKTIIHPVRPDQPIFIAAEGPKNVELAAEVADGWTAFYLSPQSDTMYRRHLEAGFARRGGRPEKFEVVGQIQIAIANEVEEAADRIRPHIAFMVGGMGSPEANFHYNALARVGFEAECAAIHREWSEGNRKGATAAVPTRLVERMALVGPPDKIRHDLAEWRETSITILLPMLTGSPVDSAHLRLMADLVLNG